MKNISLSMFPATDFFVYLLYHFEKILQIGEAVVVGPVDIKVCKRSCQ